MEKKITYGTSRPRPPIVVSVATPSIFQGEIFVDVSHSIIAIHYLPSSPQNPTFTEHKTSSIKWNLNLCQTIFLLTSFSETIFTILLSTVLQLLLVLEHEFYWYLFPPVQPKHSEIRKW